jgi:type I restriction enzyme, S subunit
VEVKPGYKRTEVGVIPEDWLSVELRRAVDLLTGFPFPSSGFSGNGVRLLRGSNVKRGNTDWSTDITAYWPQINSALRRYILEGGDVVVAMDGSLVGRSYAMLSKRDLPALLLQRVARVRSKAIDQSYLKCWICSQRFTDHCDKVKTVTAIPHISSEDIKSFRIALPPTRGEQQTIARVLSDSDALIESLEQLIAKKRLLKQAAMQELLTGKRRLPGFSGEWEVKAIGGEIDLLTGFPFPSSQYSKSGIRLLRGSNVKRGLTDWSEDLVQCWPEMTLEIKKFELKVGDLVIAMDGSLVGRSYARLEIADLPALLLQRVARIRSKTLDISFLTQFVGSETFIMYCDSVKTVTAIPHISANDIRNLRIPVPPTLGEQKVIGVVLADMDAEIAAVEAKLVKAQTLKQGMMQELLTGRTRLV